MDRNEDQAQHRDGTPRWHRDVVRERDVSALPVEAMARLQENSQGRPRLPERFVGAGA